MDVLGVVLPIVACAVSGGTGALIGRDIGFRVGRAASLVEHVHTVRFGDETVTMLAYADGTIERRWTRPLSEETEA